MKDIWSASNIFWKAWSFDFQSCINHHIPSLLCLPTYMHNNIVTDDASVFHSLRIHCSVEWDALSQWKGDVFSGWFSITKYNVTDLSAILCFFLRGGECLLLTDWGVSYALTFEMCSWELEFVLPEKWMCSTSMRALLAGHVKSPKQPRALISFRKVDIYLHSLSI